MKEITEIDVLRLGKKYIEEYGWIQHETGTKECGFCSLGATDRAGIDLFSVDFGKDHTVWMLPWNTIESASNYLDKEVQSRGANNIVQYNDAPGRTKQDIIAVFNMAIEMAINERNKRISKGN